MTWFRTRVKLVSVPFSSNFRCYFLPMVSVTTRWFLLRRVLSSCRFTQSAARVNNPACVLIVISLSFFPAFSISQRCACQGLNPTTPQIPDETSLHPQ